MTISFLANIHCTIRKIQYSNLVLAVILYLNANQHFVTRLNQYTACCKIMTSVYIYQFESVCVCVCVCGAVKIRSVVAHLKVARQDSLERETPGSPEREKRGKNKISTILLRQCRAAVAVTTAPRIHM